MRVDTSDEIRRLRRLNKMSQDDLANASDVSIAFIKAIEGNKKQPSVTTLFKLALALDCEPWEIIQPSWEEFKNQNK